MGTGFRCLVPASGLARIIALRVKGHTMIMAHMHASKYMYDLASQTLSGGSLACETSTRIVEHDQYNKVHRLTISIGGFQLYLVSCISYIETQCFCAGKLVVGCGGEMVVVEFYGVMSIASYTCLHFGTQCFHAGTSMINMVSKLLCIVIT